MAGMALYQNLAADLEGGELTAHVPQKSFLGLLGEGDGTAIASRGNLALEAPWLWDLKDWIDRKWMWQYFVLCGNYRDESWRPPLDAR